MPASATTVTSRQMVLVFTDIAGSVDMKSRLGNLAYSRIISRHDAIFRKLLTEGGEADIVKDTGDGFLARFHSSSRAVKACLQFQYACHAENWGDEPVRVRVGIHIGEVAELENDIYGMPKLVGMPADMAARVMGLAEPGQILMTRTVFDDARQYVREHPPIDGNASIPELKWLAHGPYLFKGNDEPIEVFEVGAVGVAPFREPPDGEKARRAVAPGDEIMLGPEGGWRPAQGLPIPRRETWQLDTKLGQGGFGEVWLARNVQTRQKTVFKFCFQAARLRGLRREVALFRVLNETLGDRADIARILDCQFDHAPYFLESEYTPAGSLADWAEKQSGIGHVPLERRLELVAQIAEALAAAHSVGVLHKDIKPSNILIRLDHDGWPRALLSDFGIGLITDRELLAQLGINSAGLTQTATAAPESSRTGTRLYMAPELLEGKPATPLSDIYALGVVLYQLVAGDLGKAFAEGWKHDVPDTALQESIILCVDGRPDHRFQSAEMLARQLRGGAAVDGAHDSTQSPEGVAEESVAAGAPVVPQRQTEPHKEHPQPENPFSIGLLVAFATIVGLGWLFTLLTYWHATVAWNLRYTYPYGGSDSLPLGPGLAALRLLLAAIVFFALINATFRDEFRALFNLRDWSDRLTIAFRLVYVAIFALTVVVAFQYNLWKGPAALAAWSRTDGVSKATADELPRMNAESAQEHLVPHLYDIPYSIVLYSCLGATLCAVALYGATRGALALRRRYRRFAEVAARAARDQPPPFDELKQQCLDYLRPFLQLAACGVLALVFETVSWHRPADGVLLDLLMILAIVSATIVAISEAHYTYTNAYDATQRWQEAAKQRDREWIAENRPARIWWKQTFENIEGLLTLSFFVGWVAYFLYTVSRFGK